MLEVHEKWEFFSFSAADTAVFVYFVIDKNCAFSTNSKIKSEMQKKNIFHKMYLYFVMEK